MGLDGVKVVDIAAGGHHNCIRSDEGAVYCWGRNDEGQLGDGSTGKQDMHLKWRLKNLKIRRVFCSPLSQLVFEVLQYSDDSSFYVCS